MTHRYIETRDADWGDTISTREFSKQYDTSFRGDGWYLLSLDELPAVVLSVKDGDKVRNHGWWLRDTETASDITKSADYPERERMF